MAGQFVSTSLVAFYGKSEQDVPVLGQHVQQVTPATGQFRRAG
jgi:hypothetical protein